VLAFFIPVTRATLVAINKEKKIERFYLIDFIMSNKIWEDREIKFDVVNM
jgi:hypothetical protein